MYVSPLRFGTGVKNKVLEAMGCCKASVFSPISIEGIPEVIPGENCSVASTTDEWVFAVSELLESNEKRDTYEKKLAESSFASRSWKQSMKEIME